MRVLLSIAQGLRNEASEIVSTDPKGAHILLETANITVQTDIGLHGITFEEERGYAYTPKKEAETLPNPFPRS